ncbi:MAG: hypothetical protein Q8P41_31550 [Pseudomonadota bacterium]|nr:hypothetical protein [Pseudomonadota bacterium]
MKKTLSLAVLLAVFLTAGVATAQTTVLNAVTTTTTSSSYSFANSAGVQAHVYSAAGSSASIVLRGGMTSTGPWNTLATISNPSATGECYQGTAYPWISAVDTHSSGTVTVKARSLSTNPGAWAPCVVAQTSTAPVFGVIKYSITNAAVVALGAALTGDITIGTLPAKSRVLMTYVDVTSAETSANALTVSLGTVATGYVDWVVASDAKTAAVYGDIVAERGATNIDGQLYYAAATTIKSHFVKTTTNLSTATAFAADVYVAYQTLP